MSCTNNLHLLMQNHDNQRKTTQFPYYIKMQTECIPIVPAIAKRFIINTIYGKM